LRKSATTLLKILNTTLSYLQKKITNIVKAIPQFPKSGRVVPEYRDENLRGKIYKNYRIVYRLKEEFIEIVAICHGAKPLDDLI